MLRATHILGIALGLTLATSACVVSEDPPTPPDTLDPECQIQADNEKGPGYPFDLETYKNVVLPALIADCSSAGCHGAPPGHAGLNIWADAAPGNCSYAKTFNSLKASIDLTNPAQSKVVTALNGTLATHPLQNQAKAQVYLDYATAAAALLGSDNTPPVSASPFDYNVFQATIQPILDNAAGKGCAGANCHGAAAGIGNFKLIPTPAAASADMEANFNAVTSKISLVAAADASIFVLKAKVLHGGGASAVVSATEQAAIQAWIQAAIDIGQPAGGCVPPDSFNLEVFRDDIQPILFGQIGNTTGCALSACHGADRAGGALVLKETNTPEQNLASFACFINLTNPIASEVLVCPLGAAGCRKSPHPGQDVFENAQDINFQRVLSFLYATKTTAAPLDFAFYARAINPMLNDVNAVQDGAQNRSCADAVSCHGVSVAGQLAPNGSNFPVIANLSDEASLQFNFSSAVNFTNFLTPEASSLFLFPTNEIANLNNPFATGLPHPGGLDFDVDSDEARLILKWAQGLRPDNAGFITEWLVGGDFSATLITSQTPVNEVAIKPSIFDPTGAAQFNQGQWDALISPNRTIDLNAEFPRAQTAGRVAYAVVYVVNTTSLDIDAQVTIRSPNAIRVYVDDRAVVQADDANNGTVALATFPAFGTAKKTTRMMVKVFQRADDQDFNFSVQMSDQFGNILSDASGELVIKLSPDGGI